LSGLTAVDALTFPAIQLFVGQATSSFEPFKLSGSDVPVITEICRRLDGLALAHAARVLIDHLPEALTPLHALRGTARDSM
jgi:predicted ATPase